MALRLAVVAGIDRVVQTQSDQRGGPAVADVNEGVGSPPSSTSSGSIFALSTLYAVWRCAWLSSLALFASWRGSATTAGCPHSHCSGTWGVGSPPSSASSASINSLFTRGHLALQVWCLPDLPRAGPGVQLEVTSRRRRRPRARASGCGSAVSDSESSRSIESAHLHSTALWQVNVDIPGSFVRIFGLNHRFSDAADALPSVRVALGTHWQLVAARGFCQHSSSTLNPALAANLLAGTDISLRALILCVFATRRVQMSSPYVCGLQCSVEVEKAVSPLTQTVLTCI